MNCIAPKCRAVPTVGSVFCDTHMKATPWQRGGWLSAHRRRLAMVQQKEGTAVTLDASSIAPRLWMGGKPPTDRTINVDAVVLCAAEFQPKTMTFRGAVLRCPLVDDTLTREQLNAACVTSGQIAMMLVSNKRVLVTCYAGLNRSGLVTALSLARITRAEPDEIIALIRRKRGIPDVLSNPAFVDYIKSIVARWRA